MATDDTGGDKQEPTPIDGLAGGGLAGLMRSLKAMGETPEDISDPEALRRAEEMAARATQSPRGSASPIDEAWERVAMQSGPDGVIGLQDVARALEAEDIAIGWDPYEPSAAPGLMLPGTSVRPYAVQVPVSQAERARQVLYGVPPQGVTYGWGAQARPESAPESEADFDSEFGFDRSVSPSRPRAGDPTLSDNERMARLASGGGSGCGVAIAVVFVVVAIAVAAALLLRG
jgi:hypothetical protein